MSKPSNPSNLRLTNRAVDTLTSLAIDARSRRYWDTELRGFYLSFSKAGVASFCLRYTKLDGRDGDFSIGRADRVTAEAARAVARAKLSALTLHGVDPVEERRSSKKAVAAKEDRSFGTLVEAYIARKHMLRDGKPLSEWRVLRSYLVPPLGKLDIAQISQQRVIDLLEDIRLGVAARAARKGSTGKQTASICHKVLKRFFKWAVASDYIIKNPADFAPLHKSSSRKRYGKMSEERFGLFWNEFVERHRAPRSSRVPLANLLYMVTLQRPIDIARARKQDINLEERMWVIPEWMTKTGHEYRIPLSNLAVLIIREAMQFGNQDNLFPGYKGTDRISENSMTCLFARTQSRFFAEGKIHEEDIEMYDCRRFGRTYIEMKLDFKEIVAEAVINHHNESRMESRYNVYELGDDVRSAQNAWSEAALLFCGRSELEAIGSPPS